MRTAIARHSVTARVSQIALAAAFVFAAAPAAAQDLSTDAVRPAPILVSTRKVATYRLNGVHGEGLPAEVTLLDRGGRLMATYRLPGQHDAQPMMVTVLDADLILQAETDKGVLTIQLIEQNDPAPGSVVRGRWTLGNQSGELRGQKK